MMEKRKLKLMKTWRTEKQRTPGKSHGKTLINQALPHTIFKFPLTTYHLPIWIIHHLSFSFWFLPVPTQIMNDLAHTYKHINTTKNGGRWIPVKFCINSCIMNAVNATKKKYFFLFYYFWSMIKSIHGPVWHVNVQL